MVHLRGRAPVPKPNGPRAAATGNAASMIQKCTIDDRSTIVVRATAHGQGRASAGEGHAPPIPPPVAAPRQKSIAGGVYLQDRAPAPHPARPQAAAVGSTAVLPR